MIIGLDHLVVLCESLEHGVRDYELLLGRHCDWKSTGEAGIASAFFQLDNTALELIAPSGPGELAQRLRQRIADNKAGIQSLVFASDDLVDDHRLMTRRALAPERIEAGQSSQGEQHRSWTRFRINSAASAGLRLFVLQRAAADPLRATSAPVCAVDRMDHCVITSPNPDRAAALYGARLGLRFALDRCNEERDLRLQWFLAGSATIEIAHRLSKGISDSDDRPMGITWHVNDLVAAHARLVAANVNISEIRSGFKPGTQVATVRSHTQGVPTLLLEDQALQA